MKNKLSMLLSAVIALIMLLSLSACGDGKNNAANSGKNALKNTDMISATTENAEKGIKITQTAAKAVSLEKYETADFSITIPKGWKVTAGGANINSYIYVSDPNESRNGMFIVLKMEPLLHSQEGKDVWQKMYDNGDKSVALFANAHVLKNPSTENFFKLILDKFTVIDRFSASNGYGAFSLGDEILRATYKDKSGDAEGMFTASIVDFGSFLVSDGTVVNYQLQSVDGGYYMAYNIVGITAVKDTFIEWESVLTKCMGSLQYSDSFVKSVNQASDDQLAVSKQISQNFNQTMDGIMSSWESRNKSTDIISQKQSDATLGYERVYDVETNEIYRATNGFTDSYDGKRFQPVTNDDMYSQAISGYIEQIN